MTEDGPPMTKAAAHALLDEARVRISAIDDELIRVIGERHDIVLDVARAKETLGLPVMDPRREATVVRRAAEKARELGVDEEMTRDVIWRIIAAARSAQEERPLGWPETPRTGKHPDP